MKLLLDAGSDISIKSNLGHSALQRAAYLGIRESVSELLDRGADLEARSLNPSIDSSSSKAVGNGKTPLAIRSES